MADNTELNPGTGGNIAATDDIEGVHFQRVKLTLGADGVNDGDVSSTNPIPVAGAVTVGNFPAQTALTDAQLRAAPVPVSAAELPLPTGAATEASLAVIAEAVRATDSPYTNGDKGVFVLGKRRDTDSTMVADGDYSGLNMDETGRLKVATQPGSIPALVQAITANAQTVPINVERASNITISMVGTSLVGHNATFEYSNNSTNGTDGNWYVIQVVRSNANTVETATGVLAATPVYGWEASVNAYKWFRVRATAHTSGTATYTILPGSYATEPIPAVQVTGTQSVSGTVTANIGTSGLVAYTDSSTNLAGAATFTGTSRDGGATPAYNLFVANAYANQAGTLYVEKSTDNTNWRLAAKPVAVAIDLPEQVEVRVTTRYMRVRYVNGTTAQTLFSLTSAYHRI